MSFASCITRFSRASAPVSCALLLGCGGTKPPDPEPQASPAYSSAEAAEKRAGTISFHYSNSSTDANMALDLGSDDVYLDMTGKPAKPEAPAPRRRESMERPAPGDQDAAPAPAPSPSNSPARPGPESFAPSPSPAATRPNSQARPDPRQDLPPEEENNNAYAPDVTDKVLSGIRKAQEFFYQKRYNEALDMVRSSLDARPTAEGHALAGSIHYMLGQPGLAKRHWQQALRLNPDMPAVVNMLEKISTPGGRGSPFPRPLAVHRAPPPAPSNEVMEAARPPEQAPYPEEYGSGEVTRPGPVPAPRPVENPPSAAPASAAPRREDAPSDSGKAPAAAPAKAPSPGPGGKAP
jgi:hypothetical protein